MTFNELMSEPVTWGDVLVGGVASVVSVILSTGCLILWNAYKKYKSDIK